jgi:hypothetical protein
LKAKEGRSPGRYSTKRAERLCMVHATEWWRRIYTMIYALQKEPLLHSRSTTVLDNARYQKNNKAIKDAIGAKTCRFDALSINCLLLHALQRMLVNLNHAAPHILHIISRCVIIVSRKIVLPPSRWLCNYRKHAV